MEAVLAEIMMQGIDARGHMHGAGMVRNDLLRDAVEGRRPQSERPAQGLRRQRKIRPSAADRQTGCARRASGRADLLSSLCRLRRQWRVLLRPVTSLTPTETSTRSTGAVVPQSHPPGRTGPGWRGRWRRRPASARAGEPLLRQRGGELHRQRGFDASRADTVDDGVADGQQVKVLSLADHAPARRRQRREDAVARRSQPEPLQGSHRQQ